MMFNKIFNLVLSLLLILVISDCNAMVASELTDPVTLTVCDSSGQPLAGVSAVVRSVSLDPNGKAIGFMGIATDCKMSGPDGKITIRAGKINPAWNRDQDLSNSTPGYYILLTGDNLAPDNVFIPETDFPYTATMSPDATVTIKLQGQTVNGEPKIDFADNTTSVLSGITSLNHKRSGDDSWELSLVPGKSYVIGWISKDMYGYQSEPFTATDGMVVPFSPGMPASFEYDLTNVPDNINIFPVKSFMSIWITSRGKSTHLSWGAKLTPKILNKPGTFKIDGLAAGKYQISFRSEELDLSRPCLYDVRDITLASGEAKKIEAKYPVFDTVRDPGDVTINGTVYDADGKPLSGKDVKIIIQCDTEYLWDLSYPILTTDQYGHFQFDCVAPGQDISVFCENSGAFLTRSSLTENAVVSVDIRLGQQEMNVGIGQDYTDIPLIWQGGNTGLLSELQGKIIVLDFWSTWCSPCRKALPHFNELAEKYAVNSNIRFVAVSGDYDHQIWLKYLRENSLHALGHARIDKSKSKYHLAKPIPFCMIISPEGKILAADNGLDIEAELDKIK